MCLIFEKDCLRDNNTNSIYIYSYIYSDICLSVCFLDNPNEYLFKLHTSYYNLDINLI